MHDYVEEERAKMRKALAKKLEKDRARFLDKTYVRVPRDHPDYDPEYDHPKWWGRWSWACLTAAACVASMIYYTAIGEAVRWAVIRLFVILHWPLPT